MPYGDRACMECVSHVFENGSCESDRTFVFSLITNTFLDDWTNQCCKPIKINFEMRQVKHHRVEHINKSFLAILNGFDLVLFRSLQTEKCNFCKCPLKRLLSAPLASWTLQYWVFYTIVASKYWRENHFKYVTLCHWIGKLTTIFICEWDVTILLCLFCHFLVVILMLSSGCSSM